MTPSTTVTARTTPLWRIVVAAAVVTLSALVGSPQSLDAKELADRPGWVLESATPPEVPAAEAAILIDAATGTVLFEKNADRIIPPASLTKIVSIHTARLLAQDQGLDLDTPAPVPQGAWAANMPPRSSLMFLGPDQEVSLWDLFRGMAVPSGNDAAVATAIRTAGSVDAFVDAMNRVVREAGYEVMRFADPAGLSSRNRITAREYADFLREYIAQWPAALEELHSVRSLTYPQPANYGGAMRGGAITQYNGNGLLASYRGADGIKTGFIWASGYNLAATADRNGFRLIAVVLGVEATSHQLGGLLREDVAATLLDYGFENFEPRTLAVPEVPPLRVWKGRAQRVAVSAPAEIDVVVPSSKATELRGVIDVVPEVTAPVAAGQPVGEIRYTLGNEVVERLTVSAQEDVPRGGLFRRIWHSIVLAVRTLRERIA